MKKPPIWINYYYLRQTHVASLPRSTNLVDLTGISSKNLKLIAKKAVQYVEKSRSLGLEIKGLNFQSVPTSKAGAVTISLQKDGKGRDRKRYSPPDSYRGQLTLSCFLFCIACYLNLGNKAHILCTNSNSRGDVAKSISTKHPKSKLQENITNLMNDHRMIDEFKQNSKIKLSSELSPAQFELIQRATSGRIKLSSTIQIMKSCGLTDIELFSEWKSMNFIGSLDESTIPSHVEFNKIPIHRVQEMMESDAISQLKENEISILKEELSSSRKELKRVMSRGLLARILNR